jgi:hypothetical protein
MSVLALEVSVLELCTKAVRHLAGEYQWFGPSVDELSRAVASRISADMAEQPKLKKADAKTVERADRLVTGLTSKESVLALEAISPQTK